MQLWQYHAIDVGTVCCKEVHPLGALSQRPWMDVQFSVFQSVAICCCTVCLFVKKLHPGRISKQEPRAALTFQGFRWERRSSPKRTNPLEF